VVAVVVVAVAMVAVVVVAVAMVAVVVVVVQAGRQGGGRCLRGPGRAGRAEGAMGTVGAGPQGAIVRRGHATGGHGQRTPASSSRYQNRYIKGT